MILFIIFIFVRIKKTKNATGLTDVFSYKSMP